MNKLSVIIFFLMTLGGTAFSESESLEENKSQLMTPVEFAKGRPIAKVSRVNWSALVFQFEGTDKELAIFIDTSTLRVSKNASLDHFKLDGRYLDFDSWNSFNRHSTSSDLNGLKFEEFHHDEVVLDEEIKLMRSKGYLRLSHDHVLTFSAGLYFDFPPDHRWSKSIFRTAIVQDGKVILADNDNLRNFFIAE